MKTYLVFIPIHEYWVYEVNAESEMEATKLALDPQCPNKQQVFTTACSPHSKLRVEEKD